MRREQHPQPLTLVRVDASEWELLAGTALLGVFATADRARSFARTFSPWVDEIDLRDDTI